ncbi:hypothetical protein [Serratia bockelmannii]|uniref:hypothetical protein n=1 Tax=Serratia bockelmannii TaxID=2703793 RepID=UPI003FA7578C
MNEQTNKLLADLLQKAASGLDSAVAFGQAQLPDVIHQLMLWKAASYSLRIVVMSLLLLGCVVLFRKGFAWARGCEMEGPGIAGVIVSGIVGVVLMLLLFENTGHLLQLWLAPKIWLIEYAAGLVRPGGS